MTMDAIITPHTEERRQMTDEELSAYAQKVLEPTYEKILVKEVETVKSKVGLVLQPLNAHSKVELRRGLVLGVGSGERVEGCTELRPHVVKPGDIVLFAWAASVETLLDTPVGRERLRFVTVDGLYGIEREVG